jgi:CheY-like chemotaxis protein
MDTSASPASCGLHFAVAIEGFSPFERGALASYFRLAAGRQPAYRLVEDLERADFVIADADQRTALDVVQRGGRERETVFVGAQAPSGALAWLQRPIEPNRIVRELDNLVAAHRRGLAPAAEPVPTPAQAENAAAPADWREGRAGGGREVLVVEDSTIARKFLAQRLQRLGYRVQVARSGELALELLRMRAFAIVFLDVVLGQPGSMDGLRLCQFIKQRSEPPQGVHPAVVMVTGLSGAMDKVRGSLAGCDAYLTKPLLDDELKAALRKLDPAFEIA